MEYLMTYGWAILIIAIVLGVLYYLGVFSGAATLGTSCLAVAGYLCSAPTMATNGQLTFTLGQSTGSTQYNVGVACAAGANSVGLPYTGGFTGAAFYFPTTASSTVTNTLPATTNSVSLISGQQTTIAGLPCFSSSPTAASYLFNPGAVGASFTGTLWYNYTSLSTAPASATNPWLTVKMATLTIKTT